MFFPLYDTGGTTREAWPLTEPQQYEQPHTDAKASVGLTRAKVSFEFRKERWCESVTEARDQQK